MFLFPFFVGLLLCHSSVIAYLLELICLFVAVVAAAAVAPTMATAKTDSVFVLNWGGREKEPNDDDAFIVVPVRKSLENISFFHPSRF